MLRLVHLAGSIWQFRKSFLKFVHEERSEMVALASDMIERVNNFDPVKTLERKKGAGK